MLKRLFFMIACMVALATPLHAQNTFWIVTQDSIVADDTASFNVSVPQRYDGLIINIDVQTISASDSLDVYVQKYDSPTGNWVTISGGTITTAAAGDFELTIGRNIAAVSNRVAPSFIVSRMRVICDLRGAASLGSRLRISGTLVLK